MSAVRSILSGRALSRPLRGLRLRSMSSADASTGGASALPERWLQQQRGASAGPARTASGAKKPPSLLL